MGNPTLTTSRGRCVAGGSPAATSSRARARSVSPRPRSARPSAPTRLRPGGIDGHLLDDPHRAGPERPADDRRHLQRREHRRPGRVGPGGRRRDRHDQADDRRPRRHRPDVYMLDRFIVAQRAAEGVLQDLTEFMAARTSARSTSPSPGPRRTSKARPMPSRSTPTPARSSTTRGCSQEAGIDPAELDVANGPITLDRLAEIANQLNETDQDGNFSRMGFVPYTHQGWHYTYGFAFGGTFFDEAACEVTPDDAGRRRRPPMAVRLHGGARPAEGQRLRRSLRGDRRPSPRSRIRSSPSASPSPSPATGSSTPGRSTRPRSTTA